MIRNMIEIAFKVMIESCTDICDKGNKLQELIKIQDLYYMIEDVIDEKILPAIFDKSKTISQEEFLQKFSTDCSKFLQPQELRKILLEKIRETDPTINFEEEQKREEEKSSVEVNGQVTN